MRPVLSPDAENSFAEVWVLRLIDGGEHLISAESAAMILAALQKETRAVGLELNGACRLTWIVLSAVLSLEANPVERIEREEGREPLFADERAILGTEAPAANLTGG